MPTVEWETAPATLRFIEEVERGEAMRLDVAAMAIAAHAYPGLDIDEQLVALDRIARHPDLHAPGTDATVLAAHLFSGDRFLGNTAAYDDPRNSYLNDVLARHLGIPITLVAVMMEVGRRVGVPVVGVGMPGHFLARDGRDPDAFFDPFTGPTRMDDAACRDRFRSIAGAGAPWHPAFLAPVGPSEIVIRMLTNLQQGAVARRSAEGVWSARLRLLVPELPGPERRRSANVLGGFGRYTEAARALDALAATLPDDEAVVVTREADGWRARAN